MQFNFEGKNFGEIFNKTSVNIDDISARLAKATGEIYENKKDYIFISEKEDSYLHKGKVFQRLLEVAKTEEEKAFIFLIFADLMGSLTRRVSLHANLDKFKDVLKNIFDL